MFEEKYAGATLEQLLVAEFAVGLRLTTERERLVKDRMQFGPFDAQTVRDGDTPNAIQATDGRPVVSFGISMEPGLRDTTIKTAILDPKDYPEFALLEREFWWLGTSVRRQARAR